MAKPKKKTSKSRDAYPKLPNQTPPASPAESHAIRETVESIVIAFVLAFLFRTFEAEAFVIPTGSMAPTLMGEHKDVDCPQCGHRFRVNASEEDMEALQAGDLGRDERRRRLAASTCLAGMCPNCRYVMPMQTSFPAPVPELRDGDPIALRPSYNGDRILVNKYLYTFSDPERWDVVVFHFPGDAKTNYIKRLVGLPGEVIRVYQGDLFVAANPGSEDADALAALTDADFAIARKPADKVLAVRQLVHDTDYDPATLYEAGWPLRWQPEPPDAASWQLDAEVTGRVVRQSYSVDTAGGGTAWLRYRHYPPSYEDWREVIESNRAGPQPRPQLITDFNAYNSRVTELTVGQNRPPSLRPDRAKLGLNWVGDLMLEADVEVESDGGQLLLDLVEAGQHFTATIELATGRATLSIDGNDELSPTAHTSISKPGRYHLALANVDDQLLLWVDGKLIDFDDSTQYDADGVFGGRGEAIPRTSDADPGDLAPAGIGARDAKLTVTRLALWRDNYYIADSWESQSGGGVVTDFMHPFDRRLLNLPTEPSLWDRFRERKHVEFPLEADQYFVMGDNSPESLDARLWKGNPITKGQPGGAYLEREQLIGKALCVYWPHSWSRIPGTPIPFPLFPNFADMRLVR